MTAEELEKAAFAVEDQLVNSARPTKRAIVLTLASLSLCSQGSSGIENTLWEALGRKSVNRNKFPTLYRLMMGRGVPSNSQAGAPSATPQASRVSEQPAAPAPAPTVKISARGFSVIEAQGNSAKVLSPDGETAEFGDFDEKGFDSSLSLTELRL